METSKVTNLNLNGVEVAKMRPGTALIGRPAGPAYLGFGLNPNNNDMNSRRKHCKHLEITCNVQVRLHVRVYTIFEASNAR
jgi:hypothetical protein